MTMKLNLHTAALLSLLTLFLLAGCGSAASREPETTEGPIFEEETEREASTAEKETEREASTAEKETEHEMPGETNQMIYAHVNGKVLKILAAENSSADAFLNLLKAGDVTVEMHDYGSFEKVGPLGISLPRNDEQITTEPGDLILYQGDQITIYYDVNSWSFTRLGKVQGLAQAELKEILGSGNAVVTFSLSGE